MINRTTQMIEGVVDPRVNLESRRKVLEQAKQPGTGVDQYHYKNQAAGNIIDQSVRTPSSVTIAEAPTTSPFGGHDPGHDLATMAEVQRLANERANMLADQGYDPNTGDYVGNTTTGNGGVINDPHRPPGPGKEPGQPGTEGPPGDLQGASREAITSQIDALTAKYNMDLSSLAMMGGQIGAQAKFLMAQLDRDAGFAQERLEGNLAGRGMFRSGVTARDTSRLQGDVANQRAEIELNKADRLRELIDRGAGAKANLAQGKANAISGIDFGNIQAELRQLALNELQKLRPEDIDKALAASGATPNALSGILSGVGGGGV